MGTIIRLALAMSIMPSMSLAAEYHVSVDGSDSYPGTLAQPFRTIQRAANEAQPGDIVTVHKGTYRERIDPPRGGTSDSRRISYQAAKGEKVVIKGSEVVKGWTRTEGDIWKAEIPNSVFGSFNPYKDKIHGDWFDPRGRDHHTGAVYLNGEWLIEAAKVEDLTLPKGEHPAWLNASDGYLLNVAWLRVGDGKVQAADYSAQNGVQKAGCSEGGECIGYIEHGEWALYKGIDFGKGASGIELRVASASEGGIIEVRLDSPEGELLGSCQVNSTGNWQSWTTVPAKIKKTQGIVNICLVFRSLTSAERKPGLWFSQVGAHKTTIWAQFPGVDPNKKLVEANVRQTVFYPRKTGINYITVRGFEMRDAATPWAPPTSEQIGLIGTNWSKGWIIENCKVSHSVCSGIALGKHGDKFDNTSADSAEGYVETIERALANGWTMDNIGGHIVRNNEINHCEQTGIVGSLGAIRSLVENNDIHDIHVRRLFSGAEMAGIKFHGAIDTVIRRNQIHKTCLGIWLDWMAQGTRVTQNLMHGNASHDLFVEVNHGPFLVDNNLFLSDSSLLDVSEGGAYVHNLFGGSLVGSPEPYRQTPWHKPHTTELGGLKDVGGGDNRFYNNLFLNGGLDVYASRRYPCFASGNVYFGESKPYPIEEESIVLPSVRPRAQLTWKGGRGYLSANFGSMDGYVAEWVTTALLGKALVSGCPYENAVGSPLTVDVDFFGKKRAAAKPIPGPFTDAGSVLRAIRVW